MKSYEYMDLDPNEYYVLHPRPAYLIVTAKPSGGLNVMAASWVTPISGEPPLVALAIGKDSLTNELLMAGREFTINIVGEEHVNEVYRAGSMSGRSIDKWRMLGFEEVKSTKISVPGIKNSYGFLECIVKSAHDAGESTLFIAEVLGVHIRKDLYGRYGWNYEKAKVLLHDRGRAFILPGRKVFAGRSV
ncbi:MAG: flavin reductase family protein [Desulfurococcaceae archaeon]